MTEKANLELVQSSDATPQLDNMISELRQAENDSNWFYQRMQHARSWWHCLWPGQTQDGRKHAQEIGVDPGQVYPWESASDVRVRSVAGIIRQHVTMESYIFWRAKIQATSLRPLISGRDQSIATRMLRWRVYTHMKEELLRELPLAWAWKHGYGLSFLGVQWEEQRRLEEIQISLADLDQIAQQVQGQIPMVSTLLDAITDPEQEEAVAAFVQTLSPILSKGKARGIVQDLRSGKPTSIPIAYPFDCRPSWTALRPLVDLIFPSDTSDLQKARFVSQREWVSETELRDRIETMNYDPGFVEAAVKQKGMSDNIAQNEYEPSNSVGSSWSSPAGKRNLIELQHFYFKAITNGTPTLYKTVFNSLVKGSDLNNPLYATHDIFPYAHGQYPFIPLRRIHEERALLTSKGIAEEAYTMEQTMKTQLDGINDRTSLVLTPPMIVPFNRVKEMSNTWLPKSTIGSGIGGRDPKWMELPPWDNTPVEIIAFVKNWINEHYALFGVDVDPDLKKLRREEMAMASTGEIEMALGQTLALMQDYEKEEDVKQVAGEGEQQWHIGREAIQGKFEITATISMEMLDENAAERKLTLLAQAMPFKQEGALFKKAMEIIDPDEADLLANDQVSPAAMEKEKDDERNALGQMMSGIEPPMKMFGNHQLRLQTLMETLQQPNMQKRLMQNPDSQELIQNRIKFLQNQIQQFTQNPQIGRALATKTFDKTAAPELSYSQNGTQ